MQISIVKFVEQDGTSKLTFYIYEIIHDCLNMNIWSNQILNKILTQNENELLKIMTLLHRKIKLVQSQ